MQDIEVTVRDKTYTLSLTLSAMEKVNAEFGSLIQARERVMLSDFDATCKIIAAGAGLTRKQAQELRGEVFAAGIVNVTKPVHDFVMRMFDPEGRAGADGDGDESPGEA